MTNGSKKLLKIFKNLNNPTQTQLFDIQIIDFIDAPLENSAKCANKFNSQYTERWIKRKTRKLNKHIATKGWGPQIAQEPTISWQLRKLLMLYYQSNKLCYISEVHTPSVIRLVGSREPLKGWFCVIWSTTSLKKTKSLLYVTWNKTWRECITLQKYNA